MRGVNNDHANHRRNADGAQRTAFYAGREHLPKLKRAGITKARDACVILTTASQRPAEPARDGWLPIEKLCFECLDKGGGLYSNEYGRGFREGVEEVYKRHAPPVVEATPASSNELGNNMLRVSTGTIRYVGDAREVALKISNFVKFNDYTREYDFDLNSAIAAIQSHTASKEAEAEARGYERGIEDATFLGGISNPRTLV